MKQGKAIILPKACGIREDFLFSDLEHGTIRIFLARLYGYNSGVVSFMLELRSVPLLFVRDKD